MPSTPQWPRDPAALRFFFKVTLERDDLVRRLTLVSEPRRVPIVLSPEEVARLLTAAPGVKYKAALGVAYGAGLRVSEVVALKVSDIDNKRRLLRVDQGKGRKDRFVMLSPQLLPAHSRALIYFVDSRRLMSANYGCQMYCVRPRTEAGRKVAMPTYFFDLIK